MERQLPAGFRHPADLVAIGASAGGIDALCTLLTGLPASYPVPLVLLLHQHEGLPGLLAQVLGHRLQRPVEPARAGAPVAAGVIHVAPAGAHLRVRRDRTFSLDTDPPVQWARPSIDVLLESVAAACGPRSVAMVLTGAGSDGARGLRCIRQAGALALVQDPADALFPAMPLAAIAAARPDFVLPLAGLHAALQGLTPAP